MLDRICLALVGVGVAGIAAGAFAQPAATATQNELPPGAGRDLTQSVCSSCHSPAILAHQRLSNDDWADLVYQMADRGALASDEELSQIIDYLARTFPPDATDAS